MLYYYNNTGRAEKAHKRYTFVHSFLDNTYDYYVFTCWSLCILE